MHFEVTPSNGNGKAPITFYKAILKTDDGTTAAAITVTSTGAITIYPAAGYSIDSFTNDAQTETRVELSPHKEHRK